MPSIASSVFSGGCCSRASGWTAKIRRRVSISRASGNCTATTPVLLQMMPQRPMAVSNIV
ncbi:hypothetical protein ACVME8_004422 [Bradyrhizobium diazoefficiens]